MSSLKICKAVLGFSHFMYRGAHESDAWGALVWSQQWPSLRWTCLKAFSVLLQGRGKLLTRGSVRSAVCPRGLWLAVSHFKASKEGIRDECSSGATLPGFQSWLLVPAHQMTLDTCLRLSESWFLIVSRERTGCMPQGCWEDPVWRFMQSP